jgi:hypothetical protein
MRSFSAGRSISPFGGFAIGPRFDAPYSALAFPRYGFVGEPAPSATARTETVKVVAKSAILRVGSSVGSVPCLLTTAPVPLPGLPLFPIPTAVALRAAAAMLDRFITDHIRNDAKDRMYRMFTQQTFQVVCEGDQIASVTAAPVDTDVGQECLLPGRACIDPPPLTATKVTLKRISSDSFAFGWSAKGRPPMALEVAVQAICPRTSRFIWHTVEGTIRCGATGVSVGVNLSGSRFPTHAVFVNGILRTSLPQGPLASTWIPHPSDPSMVR